MERSITANGTDAFFLPHGEWRYEVSGTFGGATTVDLKAGPSEDGSDHVAVTDESGVAVQHSGASTPEPLIMTGGGYFSLVTASYSGSSDLVAHFRRAGAES